MGGIGKRTITFSEWVSSHADPRMIKLRSARRAYEFGAMTTFGGKSSTAFYYAEEDLICIRAEREGRQDAQATIEGGVLTVLCDCCMQPFPVFNRRDKK